MTRSAIFLLVAVLLGPGQGHAAVTFCGRRVSLSATKLVCVGKGLSDLSVLKRFARLKKLYVSKNTIRDLSPLRHLRTLRVLDLSHNQVADISPLRGHKLWSLKLDHNPGLRDLTALKNNRTLRTLTLQNTQVRDVTPLIGSGLRRATFPPGVQLCSSTRCAFYPAMSPDGKLIVLVSVPVQRGSKWADRSPITVEKPRLVNRNGRSHRMIDLRRFVPISKCGKRRVPPGYSLKLLEDDEGTLVLRRGKRVLRKYRVQETDGDTVYYCAPTKRLIVVQATDPATAHDEHSAYSHTVITY